MVTMSACVARVRRSAESEHETAIGVLISGNLEVLVDSSGKVIPAPVYDYHLSEYAGCFQVTFEKPKDLLIRS